MIETKKEKEKDRITKGRNTLLKASISEVGLSLRKT